MKIVLAVSIVTSAPQHPQLAGGVVAEITAGRQTIISAFKIIKLKKKKL